MTTDERPAERVEETQTLTEHLGELRTRIIRSALAVLIGMVVIIAFYDQVLDFLKQPYVDLCRSKDPGFCDPDIYITSPTEGLSTRIRVGMYGGIIAALPVILWQVWRFIVPALHAKEKKYAIPFVLSSVVLFCAGGTMAYITVGRALDFLIGWAGEDVNEIFTVGELHQPDRVDDLRLRHRVPPARPHRVPATRRRGQPAVAAQGMAVCDGRCLRAGRGDHAVG